MLHLKPFIWYGGAIASSLIGLGGLSSAAIAQTDLTLPAPRPQDIRPLPTEEPAPIAVPETLPSPDQLLPNGNEIPFPVAPGTDPATQITVTQFVLAGGTVYSEAELQTLLTPYLNRPLTFAELLEARSAITARYAADGYRTSGAFIPPQDFTNGTVTLQIIEGQLAALRISGNQRLNRSYIRDRLEPYVTTPLNLNELLEGLQLLQLDPLIANVSSELAAGLQPGTSILDVTIAEADSFAVAVSVDNYRVPSVGSVRNRIELREANVLGDGESLTVSYANTRGSNALDGSFQIFTHPANHSTLSLRAGITASNVIEAPFSLLDFSTSSYFVELSYRHPLWRRPTEEFALGLTASHQQSRTVFGGAVLGQTFPYAIATSDDEGRSRVTALRFFQDWTRRENRQVFALRSEFSLGLDVLDPLIQDDLPDSRFLSWRGQGQWVRLLDRDSLFILRADAQLADQALMPLEQFGLGGGNSVRGYRQDLLLTDNGVLVSAEARFPVLRVPEWEGLLQVAPFIEAGMGWNANGSDPDPNTLVGVGLGLLWQQGDRLSARLNWGIPLVDVDLEKDTWQEEGITFSVVYTPF